ncbi:MAG: LuxR C-terminal-related transcriptional regulator, partial [Candidatus Dormibacteraceae bacterium]
ILPNIARARLIGRDAQVEVLERAVGRLLLGVGDCVGVRGSQGAGKTRLLEEAAGTARATEIPLWWCESGTSRRSEPLGALRNAIYDGGAGRARPANRYELLNEIEARVQTAPHLLVVDDIQSADVATVSVLAELADHIQEIPLLILFSLRTGDPGELPATLLRGTALETPPLCSTGTAELAQEVLGAAPGPELLRALARCEGNPAYLWTWLRLLAAEGRLLREGDTVDLARDPGPPPPLRSLTVQALAAVFGPAVLRVLGAASVLGRDFLLADLAAVAGITEEEATRQLELLAQAGAVEQSGPRVRTRWPGLLSVLYGSLEPAERTRMHRAYGHRLELGGASLALIAEHHLAGAGPGDRVAVAAGRSGARAVLLELPETATELLRQTLTAVPETDPEYDTVLADLAEAEIMAGEVVAAERHAEEGRRRQLATPEVERRFTVTLLDALMLGARGEEVLHLTSTLLDRPDVTEEGDRRALHARRAWAWIWLLRLDDAENDARAALRGGREEILDHASSIALAALAHLAALAGDPARALRLLSGARPEDAAGGWLAVPNTFTIVREADALIALDRYQEAQAVLHRGLDGLERLGRDTLGASTFLGEIAYASYCAGAWDDATAECEAALAAARVVGSSEISEAEVLRAEISAGRGDWGAARRIVTRVEKARERGRWMRPNELYLIAQMLERRGDAPAAAAAMRAAWTVSEEQGDHRELPFILPHVLRLARAAGSPDALIRRQVEPMAGQLLTLAQRWGSPSVLAASTLARGVRDANLAAVVQAAQRYRSSPRAPDRGVGLEVCAEELLRAGQRQLGLEAVFGALDVYRALGAAPAAARMSARLRSLDVRRGTRSPRLRPEYGWESLGTTELRIAALVSSGLSNPQIAKRTGLSRHTVAAHVGQLMSKLGVASRFELGLLVARRARDDQMLQKRAPSSGRAHPAE